MASTDVDIRNGVSGIGESRRAKIRRLLMKGYTIDQIATKLAKGDKRQAISIRAQLHQMIAEDEATQVIIGMVAKGQGILALPSAMEALSRRAAKGNVPAIKLLFESVGFHNPRVQHEHSGDIQITLKGIDRPSTVDDHQDADVTDAEVVDD